MIITKSISRFARNTVTLLKTVRELKLLGIDVFFEENKIHSLQAEGEVLLTILSSYAQAESFSASENTKWRIRKGFERGEVMNWRFMYGYNITKDSVEIDEAEAAVIREVFDRARDGESFRSICRDLNDRGIRGLLGGKWSTAYLYQVLSNEKYAGNALLQKTFVNNHIDKKVVRNNGELPRVFVEGSHPPIIDQATFDAVQVIIARNKAERAGKKRPEQCEFTGHIPILFMTAKDDIASKQRGFRIGVDDYMVKPIDLDELFLRIGALLRRAKIASSRKLEVGSFVMDADEHTAELNGEEIPLTVREFNILYKLLSYPKKTFTRQQLMDEFWDAESETAPRAVDVYMTKLRSKLADCDDFEIKTVHGLGYKAVIK